MRPRPRSTAPALALTGLVLAILIPPLSRPGERIEIRITSPPATPEPVIVPGVPITLEGTITGFGNVYRRPQSVIIELEMPMLTMDLDTQETRMGTVSYRSNHATFDAATGRFSGTLTTQTLRRAKPPMRLGIRVIDSAGRYHGLGADPPAPGSWIAVRPDLAAAPVPKPPAMPPLPTRLPGFDGSR